ncbi:MAG TPA: hypothetical protein V6D14_22915 [Coleofasciculaceae cyanobacterium]
MMPGYLRQYGNAMFRRWENDVRENCQEEGRFTKRDRPSRFSVLYVQFLYGFAIF